MRFLCCIPRIMKQANDIVQFSIQFLCLVFYSLLFLDHHIPKMHTSFISGLSILREILWSKIIQDKHTLSWWLVEKLLRNVQRKLLGSKQAQSPQSPVLLPEWSEEIHVIVSNWFVFSSWIEKGDDAFWSRGHCYSFNSSGY